MIRVFRPLPAESLRLIVFDLDGTLIDSAQDLCNSVNAMLTNFGLKPLPDAVIASYVGDGAAMLVRRALAMPGEMPEGSDPDDPEFFEEAFAYFLDYYRLHKLDFTYVYPGVLEALEALRLLPDGSVRPMAVLTNKPVNPARGICEALGLGRYFFRIYGGNSFETKKPDPEGLAALMAEAGATAEQTLMVGDSDVDVATARNVGAWTLGCTFGLSPEALHLAQPDVLVDSASEWPLALGLLETEARITPGR